jgi:hypothetical protein
LEEEVLQIFKEFIPKTTLYKSKMKIYNKLVILIIHKMINLKNWQIFKGLIYKTYWPCNWICKTILKKKVFCNKQILFRAIRLQLKTVSHFLKNCKVHASSIKKLHQGKIVNIIKEVKIRKIYQE